MAVVFVVVTVIWAYGVVTTKKLPRLNTFQINFHFGTCTLFTAAFLYPVFGQTATASQMGTGILTTGIPMAMGQFLFIGAFTITDKHGKVSVMAFALVIMSYLISIFRYHEKLNPVAAVGTVLALFGVIKCIFNKN